VRGNRRWGVVTTSFQASPGGPREVEHWVPRGVPGKPTVTACGAVLPFSFAFWWDTGAPRCAECVVARGVRPLGKVVR
jgi:hypothetical protein